MALYDYTRQRSGELSFRRGERMSIVGRPSAQWWRARIGDESGLVPAAYLSTESGAAAIAAAPTPALARTIAELSRPAEPRQQLTLAELEARARAWGVSPTRLRSALRSRSPRSATLHLIEEAARRTPALVTARPQPVAHRSGSPERHRPSPRRVAAPPPPPQESWRRRRRQQSPLRHDTVDAPLDHRGSPVSGSRVVLLGHMFDPDDLLTDKELPKLERDVEEVSVHAVLSESARSRCFQRLVVASMVWISSVLPCCWLNSGGRNARSMALWRV